MQLQVAAAGRPSSWDPTSAVVFPARFDLAGRAATALVAAAFGVDSGALLSGSRREARVAAARQVAMYVNHVTLGQSLSEVGRRFGRDRTTARYACGRVEDLRDDASFDYALAHVEAAALKLAAFARLA